MGRVGSSRYEFERAMGDAYAFRRALESCSVEIVETELKGIIGVRGDTYAFRELLSTGLCALWDSDMGEWLVDTCWLSPGQSKVLSVMTQSETYVVPSL